MCGRDTCYVPSKTQLLIHKHEVKWIYPCTTSDKTGCYLHENDISGVWLWTGLKWFRTGYKFRLSKHSQKRAMNFLTKWETTTFSRSLLYKCLPCSLLHKYHSIAPSGPPHFYLESEIYPNDHESQWTVNQNDDINQTNDQFPVESMNHYASAAGTLCLCRWELEFAVNKSRIKVSDSILIWQ